MPSKYWIKLYHEILEDPKMGKLPDNLWRRAIELFLLAGDLDNGGSLPDIEGLSWRLRTDKEHLETDLVELASVGIVSQVDGVWIVTNFSKRQEPVDNAVRVAQHRKQKRKDQYYGNEPVTNRYTDTDTDTDKIIDLDKEQKLKIFRDVTLYTPDFEAERVINIKFDDILLNQKQLETISDLVGYLKPIYEKWCKSKRDNGMLFNPRNPNWLDWATHNNTPDIPVKDTEYRKDEEGGGLYV